MQEWLAEKIKLKDTDWMQEGLTTKLGYWQGLKNKDISKKKRKVVEISF